MKMPRLRLVKSLSQKAFLLTATSLFILLVNFSPLQAEGDYTFRDQNYEEISLPRKPVIRFKQPGALFKEAAFHRPKIEVKSRREGLETVRILTFNFEKKKIFRPSL